MMTNYEDKLRRAVVFALVVSVMLVAAACGRGRNAEPTPEPAPVVNEQAATATSAPAPTEASEATPTAEAEAEEGDGEEAESATQPESPLSAQESPLSALDSPLSAADSPLAPPAPTPTISDETGGVIGSLLFVTGSGEIVPVPEVLIGIGQFLPPEEGVTPEEEDRFATYSASTAEREYTDALGRFAVGNLVPGRYVLVLDTGVNHYGLKDPETGRFHVVEIEAGEVTDIGSLQYASLPLRGFTGSE